MDEEKPNIHWEKSTGSAAVMLEGRIKILPGPYGSFEEATFAGNKYARDNWGWRITDPKQRRPPKA
jgi:hypothetical protein